MSDFADTSPPKFTPLDEEGKKEQARLRKELGWDEQGRLVEPVEQGSGERAAA